MFENCVDGKETNQKDTVGLFVWATRSLILLLTYIPSKAVFFEFYVLGCDTHSVTKYEKQVIEVH